MLISRRKVEGWEYVDGTPTNRAAHVVHFARTEPRESEARFETVAYQVEATATDRPATRFVRLDFGVVYSSEFSSSSAEQDWQRDIPVTLPLGLAMSESSSCLLKFRERMRTPEGWSLDGQSGPQAKLRHFAILTDDGDISIIAVHCWLRHFELDRSTAPTLASKDAALASDRRQHHYAYHDWILRGALEIGDPDR